MLFRKRHNIRQLSDEDLVSLYKREKEPNYVGELFERYTDLAFLVAMKYVKQEDNAKDVVMQVFEKMIKDLARYEVRNFKFWFHTVVKNQALAYLEKEQRNQRTIIDMKNGSDHLNGNHEEKLEAILDGADIETVRIAELPQAIAELRPEQRTCIELFYLKQQSYKDISDHTGFTLMQVKSYIQNGKRNLKNTLSQLNVD
ncbi:MAG: RNA polymerase sigma factor [Bacteroidia bacterium]